MRSWHVLSIAAVGQVSSTVSDSAIDEHTGSSLNLRTLVSECSTRRFGTQGLFNSFHALLLTRANSLACVNTVIQAGRTGSTPRKPLATRHDWLHTPFSTRGAPLHQSQSTSLRRRATPIKHLATLNSRATTLLP
jgi:hypothetical protein